MAQAIETVIQNLQQKIDILKAPAEIKDWEFKLVRPNGKSGESTQDGWQAVRISHSWSSADGEGWFRKDVRLPESIEGIDLKGSLVEFEFMLPIGAGILLNGVEVYREQSWTDSRAVRLKLEEHFDPKLPLLIEVRCNAADGLAQFLNSSLEISHLAEVIFKLDLVKSQITFCRFLSAKEEGSNKPDVLEKAVQALDLDSLAANNWTTFWASVDSFLKILTPFQVEAKNYTAHLIAHSHIDMNWLWPQSETVDVCRRDFSTMLKLMDRYPEFHFSQSQTATYDFMETDFPAIFDQIRAQAARGNWDVTASTWVEGDLNMAAGETLVRQLLLGRRYAQDHFGSAPLICWEPDTFGHPASMPQLLKKSGVQYYYFCRAGKDYPLFWWQGLDGSRVLAVQDPKGYGGVINPTTVVDSVIQFASASGSSHGLFVYGVGDHGGGGTAADIEAARAINSAAFMPTAIPDSTVNFYQKSEIEAGNLPVVNSELNTTFEGCYTSHGDIKKLNRSSENLLLSTESALAQAQVSGGNSSADLTQAWQTLCFHQFHDILCGCAISVTYREARQRLEQMQKQVRNILDQALSAIAEELDTSCGSPLEAESKPTRLVAFNPLGWERASLVHFSIEDFSGKKPDAVADDAGKILPIQESSANICFMAEELPAFGARVYRPVYNQQLDDESYVHIDPATQIVDNGILRLHVNPETGEIDLLEDLVEKKVLVSAFLKDNEQGENNPGYLNRLEISWEKPHTMSAWVIGEISHKELLLPGAQTRVIESGPVRAIIETRRPFLNSSITQRIILSQRSRRIDFETTVDWHEHGSANHDAPMLRVHFNPGLDTANATFEIPFAGLQREANGREVPALRWIDLSEQNGDYGLSLLNDCKYGHQIDGGDLSLTLLRASYEPDLNPDEGLHTFTYSIYPHPGGWEKAQTIKRAAELNQPALTTKASSHSGKNQPGKAWLSCQSDTVLVSAFKLAEDQPKQGTAYVVRLYENSGRPGMASVSFGSEVTAVFETDLMERPESQVSIMDSKVNIDFSPFEIKTLLVNCP